MAGPFQYFRKNQKSMLAVFGVLLMVSFLVVPLLTGGTVALFSMFQSSQDGPTTGGPPGMAVSWRHNEKTRTISEGKLRRMRQNQDLATRFLEEVRRLALERKATPNAVQMGRSDHDRGLLITLIMAKKANDMGVEVTDEMIFEYLDQISGSAIARREYTDILVKVDGDKSQDVALFEQLRTELMAYQYLRLAGLDQLEQQLYGSQFGPASLSPTLARHYYDRLHRKVSIETLGLPVEDYLDQVSEPSDGELTALYEQYKENYAIPEQPEPGFKKPPMRRFQFYKAEFETYLVAAMTNVTDEEVKQYYDENKESYRVEDEPEETPDSDTPDSDTPDSDTPDSDTPDSDTPDSDTPDSDTPDSDTPKADPPKADPPKADPPKTDPPKSDPPKTDPPKSDTPKDDDQSRATPDGDLESVVTFTSLVDDDPADSDPADSPKPAPPKEDPAPTPSDPATPPDPKDSPPKADPPKADPPKADPPSDPAPANDTPSAKPTEPTDAPTDAPTGEEKPPKYKPLEDEAEGIKRNLAREPAQNAMIEAMDQAEKELRKYYRLHSRWEGDKLENASLPEPPLPDFKALAKEWSLTLDETSLVDILTMRDHELGKVTENEFLPGQQQPRQRNFLQMTYDDGDQEYKAERILNGFYFRQASGFGMVFNVDAGYVFWPTEIADERVPDFAEARDEVVAAWKFQQARTLAEADANEMKKEVEEAGEDATLKSTFSDADVKETKELTWMTTGDLPMGANSSAWQSEIEAVDGASVEFMEMVFDMQAGQIELALNGSQSIVYLVRLAEITTTPAGLDAEFLTGSPHKNPAIRNISRGDVGQMYNQWFMDFEREVQINWIIEPYAGNGR